LYFVKTPNIIKPLYRDLIWNFPSHDKVVYLTFDDGPTPEVTNKVFEILNAYQAKATFFLIGNNVKEHPEYLSKYEQKGHRYGNHSYTHPNGWQTDTKSYLEDVERAGKLISSNLFRPPYGRIKREQSKQLRSDYHLIMWDVLSGDFDKTVDVDQCYRNVVNNVESGSIVVFHDSKKFAETMLATLPRVLDKLTAEGYRFDAIRL